ncbi:MAG: hypothetical protein HY675_19765 [Chloroflexi bacterium]|nr:hypothetical protein [Chloroflexota bacterium]
MPSATRCREEDAMIERYSRPEMAGIWSAENKVGKWLQVEIAACEAWATLGVVPAEALPRIRLARFDLRRMAEIVFPESFGLLDYALSQLTSVLENLQVYPERMRRNLERTRGLVFSQRVLLALIDKGIGRKQAYEVVQRNAMRARREEQDFRDLLAKDPAVAAHLSPEELRDLFSYEYYLRYVEASLARVGLSETQSASKSHTPEGQDRVAGGTVVET